MLLCDIINVRVKSFNFLKTEENKVTYGWAWVAIIVIAIILEAVTDQLVSIWFVPAAIVATVMDFFGVDLVWQVIVFFIISAVGIILAKTIFSKFKRERDSRTNIEAIIGERCVVTERIDNFAGCGQARVNGQIWSARGAYENDTFEVGEVLNIVAIEGVKLICKK